jgi:catechol 2,3-dioxygenase-like lactoylglutathione lyase family enzyme
LAAIDTRTVLHAAIAVPDLDAAVAAWTELLGRGPSSVTVTGSPEEAQTHYRGGSTPARVRLAFFDFGPFSLELMEPIGSPSVWADHVDAGGGLHHLALTVRGMDDGLQALEALGLPLVQRGEFDGGRYAYVDSA